MAPLRTAVPLRSPPRVRLYVAQRFAVDHPDRILGLVLVGSPRSLQGRRAPFADAVEAMQDPVDPELIREVLGTLPLIQPVPEAFVEAMLAESAKVPADVWRVALAELTAAVRRSRPPRSADPLTTARNAGHPRPVRPAVGDAQAAEPGDGYVRGVARREAA